MRCHPDSIVARGLYAAAGAKRGAEDDLGARGVRPLIRRQAGGGAHRPAPALLLCWHRVVSGPGADVNGGPRPVTMVS